MKVIELLLRFAKKILIVSVPLFLLGVLFSSSEQSKSSEIKEPQVTPPPFNFLLVFDQIPGEAIEASSISIKEKGFLVVYRATENGFPQTDQIVGVSELLYGIYSNEMIPTKQQTKTGDRLIAILHKDNGDGIFTNEREDNPLVDKNNAVVSDTFVIAPRISPGQTASQSGEMRPIGSFKIE